MKTLKIVIERGPDDFGAYAENAEGIYGAGSTPQEAKDSILEAIKIIKKHNKEENIPDILKGGYKIAYRYDTESLLKYYRFIFSNPAWEKLTGINQKLIAHYSSGLKTPRPQQRKKIETALHQLGRELLAVEL
ncbi:MAG TPA: hypothetical protein VMI12_08300 [Puia sp.]|nr:hypothetical protein [Puia sp.]